MTAHRAAALSRLLAAVSSLLLAVPAPARAGDLAFDRIVIDADFPGGYQVEVADVNGDGKPDIVAVGGSRGAWYENPTWKKHYVTGANHGRDVKVGEGVVLNPGRSATPGIISSATA